MCTHVIDNGRQARGVVPVIPSNPDLPGRELIDVALEDAALADLHVLRAGRVNVVILGPRSCAVNQVDQCLRRRQQITIPVGPYITQLGRQRRLPSLRGTLVPGENKLSVGSASEKTAGVLSVNGGVTVPLAVIVGLTKVGTLGMLP